MPAVLGIDAAWTANEPSGVALLVKRSMRWHCLRLAPSYAAFCDNDFSWDAPVRGGIPDVKQLLGICSALIGNKGNLKVVAVDMPLANRPIIGRRAADDIVSRQFGARKCAVHSPTIVRPGMVGAELHSNFIRSGFSLDVDNSRPSQALLEVYPHVALLSLMNATERLPYKASKTLTYWGKACAIEERKRRLLVQWADILKRLRKNVDGIELPLPSEPGQLSFQHLKRYEDAIDALVCAWMATRYLANDALPLGDGSAAIWIPSGLD